MRDRLVVSGFKQFGGKHCETASLRNVLDYNRLPLSEEMLLGLGGGVGFIYWCMKTMPARLSGPDMGSVKTS